jgi:hypothetical protein
MMERVRSVVMVAPLGIPRLRHWAIVCWRGV